MFTRIRPILARKRPGFTLLEATLSVLLTGVLLCASLAMVGAFARARANRQDQSRATLLADQLMGEILQYAYSDPNTVSVTLGPEAGETRATFNDVDDFNGWTDSPPQYRDGTAIPGYTGWSRSVTVNWVDPTNPANVVLTDMGLKRISVTVTSPSKQTKTITALRSKNGLYEHTPGAATTYTSAVFISLQPGTDASTSVSDGVNTVNQVP